MYKYWAHNLKAFTRNSFRIPYAIIKKNLNPPCKCEMICLIMGKHNNPFVSQWKIKQNIEIISIPQFHFPYVLLIQL